jgi:hypothetical protein
MTPRGPPRARLITPLYWHSPAQTSAGRRSSTPDAGGQAPTSRPPRPPPGTLRRRSSNPRPMQRAAGPMLPAHAAGSSAQVRASSWTSGSGRIGQDRKGWPAGSTRLTWPVAEPAARCCRRTWGRYAAHSRSGWAATSPLASAGHTRPGRRRGLQGPRRPHRLLPLPGRPRPPPPTLRSLLVGRATTQKNTVTLKLDNEPATQAGPRPY